MPTYHYRAKDRAGKTVTGSLTAEDKHATARILRDKGLWPMEIELSGDSSPVRTKRTGAATATQGHPTTATRTRAWSAPGVPLKDLAVYFRQLAGAVHSGMPLSRCMEIMRDQSGGTLKKVSAEAADAVHHGHPLSVTFARHPRLFSPLILATLRAGEVGGRLDDALNRIAEMLERQYELNQKIKQQTFLPKLTLGMAVLICVIVKVVIGSIAPEGARVGQGFGNVIVPAVGALAALYFLGVVIARLGTRSRLLDQVKLAFPLLGKVVRGMAMARFSRGLASLYRAGVSLPEALETAAQASGNQVFAEQIQAAIPAVQRGRRLVEALTPLGILPPMALNMVRTGEETGNLDEMLDKVAEYAEAEAETATRSLATAVGPLLILFMGVLIGMEVISFALSYAGALGAI
ncbi:MAG TPA: type II secretion system F family protein [Armatimonadetes bacterium]|jgi:type IV pilus assembly protein PilC|nr:type II secretion system F family protein [Armatimonadota bacterium]